MSYEEKVKSLMRRGWQFDKEDVWTNPKHLDCKRVMLFTFDQACKAEQLN